MATYVAEDREAAGGALAGVLKRQPIVNALLEALWPLGTVNVTGAVSLFKRLTKRSNEQHARRLLNVLNQAGLVAYNRNNPKMRILFNPAELVSPEEAENRERERAARVISRDTPYSNVLALRSCYGTVRLLSGPSKGLRPMVGRRRGAARSRNRRRRRELDLAICDPRLRYRAG